MGRISNATVVAVIVLLAVLSGRAATEAARDAVAVGTATGQSPQAGQQVATKTATSYEADAVVVGAARSNAHGWRPGPAALQVRDAAQVRAELVDAYTLAQLLAPASCNLPVSLLAAIGQVESGNLAGRRIDVRNRVQPAVLGPVLDGSGAVGRVPDSDRGELDGHRRWDRAVGPMQLLPATWRAVGFDADGDGARDPQNVYDAAGAAMAFLCQAGRDLATPEGVREAVLAYHDSRDYLRLVLAWQQAYDDRGLIEVTWEPPGAELVFDEPPAQALRARSALTLDPAPTPTATRRPAPRTTPTATTPAPTTPAPTTPAATTTTTAAAEAPTSASPPPSVTATPTPTPTAPTPTAPACPTPTATPSASPSTTEPSATEPSATEPTPPEATPTPTETPTATATPTADPTEPVGCTEDGPGESGQASSEDRRNE